ncbi:cystathionine beta-lyase [Paenibacillus anaericanus]|uniref:MalY/PatB family protein n=1 Tax=Paenibacillus anaericanus TaxID=170367 RepID=UPI002786AC77|nr:MalY/PatB family protein [Paenibacillus anaericanus]MDQ0087415.1 cystathionine beta-lyase [Paenibacillus anaericanus]
MTNFDEIINRYGTNSAKWDGMAQVMDSDMIALSVADMDLRAPQAIIEKMDQMALHGIYGYTELFPKYYEATRQWFKKAYDWEIPTDWIVFCPRIVQAVSIIIQQFTAVGDRILMHTPAYQPIANSVTVNNRELVESQLRLENGRYEIDFADMEEHMKKGVKMVILVSPHNPVGRVWSIEELTRIVHLCELYDAWIVSDDIHADFIYGQNQHTIIAKLSEQAAARSFVCTSPAKTFNLASLEIANIVIPNTDLREQFRRALQQSGIHNPTFFAVPATEVAYTACDQWLMELQAYIVDNILFTKEFLAQHMPELNVIEPEGTYLLWMDCRAVSPYDEILRQWLIDGAKVNVSFGASFGTVGEGFIRLNVATPRAILHEALQRMSRTYPPRQITE